MAQKEQTEQNYSLLHGSRCLLPAAAASLLPAGGVPYSPVPRISRRRGDATAALLRSLAQEAMRGLVVAGGARAVARGARGNAAGDEVALRRRRRRALDLAAAASAGAGAPAEPPRPAPPPPHPRHHAPQRRPRRLRGHPGAVGVRGGVRGVRVDP